MTIKVRLVREDIAEYMYKYYLLLYEEDGTERKIDVAQIKFGGMTLVNYEVSRHNGRQILSAFFYVNIMGHDLDQWLHFDLATGEGVEGYINPMQAAGRKPEKDRIETREDKKNAANKLRLILNKWGDEKGV